MCEQWHRRSWLRCAVSAPLWWIQCFHDELKTLDLKSLCASPLLGKIWILSLLGTLCFIWKGTQGHCRLWDLLVTLECLTLGTVTYFTRIRLFLEPDLARDCILAQSVVLYCLSYWHHLYCPYCSFLSYDIFTFLCQSVPTQRLNSASCLVPSPPPSWWRKLRTSLSTVHCSIPTFDPSVQHCVARKVFFAHECLGTLFTFVWLGSLVNILDVHDEPRPTVERLATVLACIAVLSCRSNSD